MNNRRKDGHSFTVSRLQALRLCPYRYHLQYELNIRVGGAASRQGIAVHAAVAGFLRRWEETDMAITTGKKLGGVAEQELPSSGSKGKVR